MTTQDGIRWRGRQGRPSNLRLAGGLRAGAGLCMVRWPAAACRILGVRGTGGLVAVRALGLRHVGEGWMLAAAGSRTVADATMALDSVHLLSLGLLAGSPRHRTSATRMAILSAALMTLTISATRTRTQIPKAGRPKSCRSDGGSPCTSGKPSRPHEEEREADETRQLILDGLRTDRAWRNQDELAGLILARFRAADLPPPPAPWLEAVASDIAAGHSHVVSGWTKDLAVVPPPTRKKSESNSGGSSQPDADVQSDLGRY